MSGGIALKKESFDILKKELMYALFLFLIALVIFKIAFFNENLVVLLRNVLSLFWLFVIPGYFIMLYWQEKLDFIERFFAGIILSAAVIGISSYYFGLIGLNIKYHAVFMPLLMIAVGITLNLMKRY